MPPPISILVDPIEQVVDHAQLVADLRTAENDGVRPLGLVGQPAEHLHLGGDEPSGVGRSTLGDVVDAGLLAMHDAEPVADEDVAQLGVLVGEGVALGLVLARLTGVEPDVLEDEH